MRRGRLETQPLHGRTLDIALERPNVAFRTCVLRIGSPSTTTHMSLSGIIVPGAGP